MRVDFAVLAVVVIMLFFMFMLVAVAVLLFLSGEQRAFQLLLADGASACVEAEQRQRVLQLAERGSDLGLVGVALGGMFETHQVHRRAFQFQLQGLAIEHHVELGEAMLVGIEAAVCLMRVVMGMIGRLDGDQGQQGKRQGEYKAAHGDLR